ncbi:hypothetical protein [Paraburkholderia panacisoli]|uniref:hypothetical protein n=1 Tax=Paraburkholderia panacisoli TaxID=2603818 RepID=UPI00165F401A|nr:hypothetical protein [Paraburkholderia panacisoli]
MNSSIASISRVFPSPLANIATCSAHGLHASTPSTILRPTRSFETSVPVSNTERILSSRTSASIPIASRMKRKVRSRPFDAARGISRVITISTRFLMQPPNGDGRKFVPAAYESKSDLKSRHAN